MGNVDSVLHRRLHYCKRAIYIEFSAVDCYLCHQRIVIVELGNVFMLWSAPEHTVRETAEA